MPTINFRNTKVAFQHKSTLSLVRSIAVLWTCQEPIVRHASGLLRVSQALLGKRLTTSLVRHTFFRVFCAGETEAQAQHTMRQLAKFGVGGILDFAAEADLEKAVSKSSDLLVMSREYEYESERQCDAHMSNFLECVRAAQPGGFAAVKVTALGDAATIKNISLCVKEITQLFTRSFPSGTCDKREFNDFVRREFVHQTDPKDKFRRIIESAQRRYHDSSPRDKPTMDILEWLSFVTPKLYVEMQKTRREIPKHFTWTLEDAEKMDRMLGRMDQIAQLASESGKKIMIDAEHTYFQPAIDALTIELQRRHNQNQPVVYSTIQAYLKDGATRLGFFLECAQRERWTYACKIVRGAYLVQERQLALTEHRPSPVHDTIEHTAESYFKCCELVLTQPNTSLVVASHNGESISQVLSLMQSLERSESVSFAQLYSMADGVTFALSENGYSVYKYLPFGEVNMVVPYLIRRGQENSSVVEGATNERNLMVQELWRRIMHEPWRAHKQPVPTTGKD